MKKFILIILLISTISILLYTSQSDLSVESYLKKNHSDLNLNDKEDLSGLEIFSEDIKDKKIILVGEHHNISENTNIEMKLLKYFQKEIGVDYYLAELGYADAYFLNKYLENGDEEILKDYFDIYKKGQQYYTEERYKHYIDIYNFNQKLPEDKRIKIVGVDIESQASYRYILDILDDNKAMTNELVSLLNTLKDFSYMSINSNRNLLIILDKLIKDIEINEENYKNIFKDDFEGFQIVINDLIDYSEARVSSKDMGEYMNKRDMYTYENFKEIDSKLKNPVYFGQWGKTHVYQDEFYSNVDLCDSNYFASLLNSDTEYKGKILSIDYGYYFDENNIGHSYSYIDKQLFKDYINTGSKATIFKLNNNKSPFNKSAINPFDTNAIDYKGKPITNYFQYLVLIKNSKPSKIIQ